MYNCNSNRMPVSQKTKNLYKALKGAAAAKYFVKSNLIDVFANGQGYTDTASVTTDRIINHDVLVFVKYGDKATVLATYAIPTRELMPLVDAWSKGKSAVVCREPIGYDNLSNGTLFRVPFAGLEGYEIEISK